MQRQQAFIASVCKSGVSLWHPDYADLTSTLPVSHALPYGNHWVTDTDLTLNYPGISQGLGAQPNENPCPESQELCTFNLEEHSVVQKSLARAAAVEYFLFLLFKY